MIETNVDGQREGKDVLASRILMVSFFSIFNGFFSLLLAFKFYVHFDF